MVANYKNPRPHPIQSRPRALRRLARARANGHELAITAALGRLAYWDRIVPEHNTTDPAGIGWYRESGVAGYRNRAARRALSAKTRIGRAVRPRLLPPGFPAVTK